MTGRNGLLFLTLILTFLPSCTSPDRVRAEPIGSAGATTYLNWLDSAIDTQERQMNRFARTADEAAERFVDNEKWSVGVIGDGGFEEEAKGRAGGLIRIHGAHQIRNRNWRGVILVGLVNHRLEGLFEFVREKREQGCFAVLFGTAGQRDAARKADVEFDGFIETGARETNGLIRVPNADDTEHLLPTQPVANMVGLWVWTGEFVAAVTRRNYMTPMYLAYTVPGGRKWRKKFGRKKFHGEGLSVAPVERGTLGARYVRALRELLRRFRRSEMNEVRAVGKRADETRRSGGDLYVFLHGHALNDILNGPHDPGLFRKANRGWFNLHWNVDPQEGDLLFCVGFDRLFDGGRFGPLAQRMRKRSVKLAWSIGVNDPQNDYSLPDDEPLIDQSWPYGDASVSLPGYPIKILPTSGIIAQSIFWMVQAEMLGGSTGK